MLYRTVSFLAFMICKVLFRISILGASNVPASGSCIVACNHASFLDPAALGATCPRQLGFMAKESLFRVPGLGWLIRAVGAFPVKREGADLGAFKEAVSRLKSGKAVLIFPEGTRSQTGDLQAAKMGVGMLAVRSGAVIVPAYIEGSAKAMPPDEKFIHLKKVKVTFGKPIDAGSVGVGLPTRGRYEAIAEKVMSEIGILRS